MGAWRITTAVVAATGCMVLALAACDRPGPSAAAARSASTAARQRVTPPPSAAAPVAASITVPDVVGQDYAATAQWAVTGANLTTAYRLEHSPTVVAGSVISETPAGGSRVPADTTVTLVVSSGPANIPGAQPCQAADLRVQAGPSVSEATGQHTRDWTFTNLGAPCVLDGYPAVSAIDQDGRVLGFAYTHSGDQMTTGAPPEPVYLPRGSAAWIRMNKYRCDFAVTDSATALQVSLPAGRGTLDVAASVDYCAEAASRRIAVSPFEPVEMLLYVPGY